MGGVVIIGSIFIVKFMWKLLSVPLVVTFGVMIYVGLF